MATLIHTITTVIPFQITINIRYMCIRTTHNRNRPTIRIQCQLPCPSIPTNIRRQHDVVATDRTIELRQHHKNTPFGILHESKWTTQLTLCLLLFSIYHQDEEDVEDEEEKAEQINKLSVCWLLFFLAIVLFCAAICYCYCGIWFVCCCCLCQWTSWQNKQRNEKEFHTFFYE